MHEASILPLLKRWPERTFDVGEGPTEQDQGEGEATDELCAEEPTGEAEPADECNPEDGGADGDSGG